MKSKKEIPDRRNGFYYLDGGRVYPSVTTILDVISKPALISWAAKMGARAALANPSLDEKEAASSIYGIKKGAGNRGQRIHWFAERYNTDSPMQVEELPLEEQGYARAYIKFVNEYKPKIIKQELKIYSDKYQYAGRLDDICQLGDSIHILDVKTGKDIYDTYAVQLTAYKEAVEEMGEELTGVKKIDTTSILLLKENGLYRFEPVKSTIEVFLAAKTLWIWKNQAKYNSRVKGVS